MKPGHPSVDYVESDPHYPTVVDALDAAADLQPDRIALICEDRQFTFAEYRRAVAGMAQHLARSHGPGDRIAMVMGNGIETAVALMGAYAARLQTAPLNPGYTDRELGRLIDDVGPAAIACSPPFAERVRALEGGPDGPEILTVGEGGLDIWPWAADESLSLPEERPRPEDRCLMFFTGGTTGLPKGAEHIHSSLDYFCRQTRALWQFEFGAETVLNVAPMFHIWGHDFTLVFPLYIRATMVIVPQYRPDMVIEQLARHRVSCFAGGPAAIFLGLLGSDAIGGADLGALRHSMGGGSPLPADLLERWKVHTGNEIMEGYGMSEGAPICLNPTHGPRKRLSVGAVPPETVVEIVDLESGTRVMPVGERGEVRLRGPQFTIGYRNRPEETAAAIRDGWLYTGDVGYLDEDGYLFLVDRKKEMILVGGFNVYPREVDEVMMSHPAVAEAAAIAVPDDFLGEAVCVYLALQPGETADVEALHRHAEANLAKYKRPKIIRIVEALPKTGPGKINKLNLKAMEAERGSAA